MKFISLAAGGEGADYDMVCYISKDDRNHRGANWIGGWHWSCRSLFVHVECYVFDCGEFSDEVLTTIGQAFVLAQVGELFQPGGVICGVVCCQLGAAL